MAFVQTEEAVYRYGEQLNVPWTPDADYDAGHVFDMGTFVTVQLEFAKRGVLTTRCWRGVFSFLKQADEVIAAGTLVLWDASNRRAYATGGGYTDDACIGVCVEDSAASDLTVMVAMIEVATTAAG